MKIQDKAFWNKVRTGSAEECWAWMGCKDKNGYGVVNRRKVSKNGFIRAHRYSFYLLNAKLPNNMACHTCDNPSCVNPNHIYDGTGSDNMRDMIARNRQRAAEQAGENNGNSKLTLDNVVKIKALLMERNNTEIASEFGVHHSTISAIRRGKIWKVDCSSERRGLENHRMV